MRPEATHPRMKKLNTGKTGTVHTNWPVYFFCFPHCARGGENSRFARGISGGPIMDIIRKRCDGQDKIPDTGEPPKERMEPEDSPKGQAGRGIATRYMGTWRRAVRPRLRKRASALFGTASQSRWPRSLRGCRAAKPRQKVERTVEVVPEKEKDQKITRQHGEDGGPCSLFKDSRNSSAAGKKSTPAPRVQI